MKQKSKVRENSEYAKVPVFQWFFLLERLPLMDAKAAINGIPRSQRFDPAYLHQKAPKSFDFGAFLILLKEARAFCFRFIKLPDGYEGQYSRRSWR